MSTLQYLSDSNGKTTGVFIPIEEWLLLKEKIDNADCEISEKNRKILDERLKNYSANLSENDFQNLINEKRAKYSL